MSGSTAMVKNNPSNTSLQAKFKRRIYGASTHALSITAIEASFQKHEHTHPSYRLVALACRGPSILSTGFNRGDKTSPVSQKIRERFNIRSMYKGSKEIPLPDELHAEVDCLKNCPSEADTLVVARFRKDGSLGCAKPCKVCEKYAQVKGIKVVWYSEDDGSFKKMRIS